MTHDPLPSWSDVASDLIAVATGRKAADTVIRGGKWVNVHTREVLRWDIAVHSGRFAYVGPDASHCIGPDTHVIDTDGYVIPGLCDAHMHIESARRTGIAGTLR